MNINMNDDVDVNELINKGFVERALMKTPSGGDYSEAHFFDENWNYTTKDVAIHMIVKEFNSMGEVINDIVMSRDVRGSLKK